MLEEDGLLKVKSEIPKEGSEWEEIVKRFAQWRNELSEFKHQRDSDLPVYVTHERWDEFCLSAGFGYEAAPIARKSGAPRRPHWEEIWKEALVRILRVGRYPNKNAFAEELEKWAHGRFPAEKNAIPKADTIARELAELERNPIR